MAPAFPVVDRLIHLNHAAVGPWPRVTAEAIKAFAEENASVSSLNYTRWVKTEQQLRERLARLIKARGADEIALIKNTSEGLSFVANGLDWRAGDNVVGIRQEFPSNRFVWDSLSSRGVEFRKLDIEGLQDPESQLMNLCDDRTRLISISAVQYYNGLRMDLARIGRFCRERDILFCVDGIQQIGALPMDVQDIHADFAIADGHKWMLAPEGLGLFYIRRESLDRLSIHQYGWHMAENMGDYSEQTFEIASTARRFECGSPNMLGIHALNASVDVLLEAGISAIGEKVLDNTRYLMRELGSINDVEIISDTREERLSGIVTFRIAGQDSDRLFKKLIGRELLCASRGGGLRFSPHFYTPRQQLDQAVTMIAELASG